MPGPSTTTTVRASADQVIHIRQNSDPTCPWRGRSGLAVAQSSGGLAATLVRGLTAEGDIPSLRIIPQPFGQSQTAADSIRGAVSTGLEAGSARDDGERRRVPEDRRAPLTDWKSYTIQPEYMAAGVLAARPRIAGNRRRVWPSGSDGARVGSGRPSAPRSVPAIRRAHGATSRPDSRV